MNIFRKGAASAILMLAVSMFGTPVMAQSNNTKPTQAELIKQGTEIREFKNRTDKRSVLNLLLGNDRDLVEWRDHEAGSSFFKGKLPDTRESAIAKVLEGLDFLMIYSDQNGGPVLDRIVILGQSEKANAKRLADAEILLKTRLGEGKSAVKTADLGEDAIDSDVYLGALPHRNAWSQDGRGLNQRNMNRTAYRRAGVKLPQDLVRNNSAGLPPRYKELPKTDPQWYNRHAQALTQQMALRSLQILTDNLKAAEDQIKE